MEPAQAHYRPGRWLAICYRASAVDRSSGRPVGLTVTVECRAAEPDAVWAFPDDPGLPGLAAAADGGVVRRRLRPSPADVTVEPLRYRPRRRAVLRYRLPGGKVLFAKVVSPGRARHMLALADALRSGPEDGLRLALPVGRIGPGALVLPFLAGASLRDLLLTGGPLPAPEHVAALAGKLHRRCLSAPAVHCASPRRQVDPGTALAAAQVVTRLLPGEAGAAARLAEAVMGRAEGSDPPEEWIVHGDLYENQLMVDGDAFGLLDLDDLGPGDPLLDAANFGAHLLLLAASGRPAAGAIRRYREELRAAFSRRLGTDPAALAWREAYCLLRLAAGPFRVLHPEWPRRMADRLSLAAEALSGR
ncbi:MAG TPA: phosphotransferase [Acidimicrobiia bacterium]|nr:phosphotransferase [Acidimicrobiia bacterium]